MSGIVIPCFIKFFSRYEIFDIPLDIRIILII